MGENDLIISFTDYLSKVKKSGSHTVTSYRNDLSQFDEYLSQEYRCDLSKSVKSSYIRSWLASLIESKNEPSTVARKLSAVRSFFKYLMKNGLVDSNPARLIKAPKRKKAIPNFVTEDQMHHLLVQPPEELCDFSKLRDNIIIELLYGAGLRLSEAIELKTSNLDLNQAVIKVLGKRNKERVIPIGELLCQRLEHYLRVKHSMGFLVDNVLVTNNGAKLYPQFIYRVVKNELSSVTTLKKKSPHVLRHTYATHLLNNGAELNAIKELLGHANLSATQIYTHTTIEKLKDAHRKAHPKS